MNCLSLVSAFLEKHDIPAVSFKKALKKVAALGFSDTVDVDYSFGEKFIFQIITDIYRLNSQNVKKCADIVSKNFGAIGRHEKNLIKHYLDYKDKESLDSLISLLSNIGATSDFTVTLLNSVREDLLEPAVLTFKKYWSLAETEKDESKKYDYLQGIYTRLVPLLNEDILSLKDIFSYNEKYIVKELPTESIKQLEVFCNNSKKQPSYKARKLFCDEYNRLLAIDLQNSSASNILEQPMNISSADNTPFAKLRTEQAQLAVLNLDQKLFDSCQTENVFWDTVFSLIYYSYRVLENHRILAVNINNIYTNDGRNLKWLAYSYIGIYAEHFIPTKEKRKFYHPEYLCFARCEHKGIVLSDEEKKNIVKYYEGKITIDDLSIIIQRDLPFLKNILLDFENVWYGYTFSDCFSIVSGTYPQNNDISFIENNNQILLIFNKYRHDERKIPCPECAGLNISGNSYPEVGLKSWECKNAFCPSRSKSNRGKRFSKKSNFMQNGFDSDSLNNQITRDLIKKWRRDVVEISNQNEIYEMLTRYFSFSGEEILLVNTPVESSDVICSSERTFSDITLEQIKKMRVLSNEFSNYFNEGKYVKRYLDRTLPSIVSADHSLTEKILSCKTVGLIHGDSGKVLKKIDDNVFSAAVTSPPYYNARLYSQWSNLYLYLSDMFEIIKQAYRTMKPGGVFLYNIGDICGNENTIVHSNMGNKRILLGAYTIHLFIEAGFELLDNLVWDKGEPQSNRQKNDGKFTPFYQKPMNVYEHMFLFKKPGAPAIINNNPFATLSKIWKTNIVRFTPVIKINSKGENILGHTAPFPLDIPEFVSKTFIEKDSDILLEPFAGSGTSLIAAHKTGKKAVGIELCNKYIDLIENICAVNDVTVTKISS